MTNPEDIVPKYELELEEHNKDNSSYEFTFKCSAGVGPEFTVRVDESVLAPDSEVDVEVARIYAKEMANVWNNWTKVLGGLITSIEVLETLAKKLPDDDGVKQQADSLSGVINEVLESMSATISANAKEVRV